MKKPIKVISLNVVGLVAILFLFNFPTFQKVSVESAEPIMLEQENWANTRDYPENIQEMEEDMRRGRELREMNSEEDIHKLLGIELEAESDDRVAYSYSIEPHGEEKDAPPEFGEPKNGHPEYSEPVIVQVINALGDNMTKLMGGLLTLSQIFLNIKAYRNRKKVVV